MAERHPSDDAAWCWRCMLTQPVFANACTLCGGELHSSPPPEALRRRQRREQRSMIEIDISAMDEAERVEFLLFMDGAGIAHKISGFLLVISAADEQRTREILAAATKDDLVELDPDDVGEESEWARTIAAMLHPSGRLDVVSVPAGASRRVVAAVTSYTIWWVLVIVLFALATVMPGKPSYTLIVVLSLVPVLGEAWMCTRWGSSPGKYLMDMRLVNDEGGRPSPGSAVIRVLVLTWPFLLAYWPGPVGGIAALMVAPWIVILIITMVRDPEGRGLHDHAAGTRVLDGRRFPTGAAAPDGT